MLIVPESYAEEYAVSNNIPYQYQSITGSSSLKVTVSPEDSSNRLEGVTATCYEKVTKYDDYDEPYEEIQFWDAEQYEQQNPLLTNAEGYYAWDVPQGLWQVRYEKDGYESAASEWMEVPPPRFDVNIGLVSYEEPEAVRRR